MSVSDLAERRNTLVILMVNWVAVNLTYYGISMGVTNLGGNIYTSFIFVSLIEIPGSETIFFKEQCCATSKRLLDFARYLIAPWLMDHWGRVPVTTISIVTCGTCCILAGVTSNSTAQTALALTGRHF